MRNLKIGVHITVYESDPKQPLFDRLVANVGIDRYIKGELRKNWRDEDLRSLFRVELQEGVDKIKESLFDQLKLPLNVDIQDKGKEIEEDLKELFPGYDIAGYFSEGVFRIYHVDKINSKYEMTNVYHPKAPEQILTYKYNDSYDRLEDGRWVYVLQCHNYYEEVLEIVPAPIDEGIVEAYFKDKGIEFEWSNASILPLPEPEVKEYHCDE